MAAAPGVLLARMSNFSCAYNLRRLPSGFLTYSLLYLAIVLETDNLLCLYNILIFYSILTILIIVIFG